MVNHGTNDSVENLPEREYLQCRDENHRYLIDTVAGSDANFSTTEVQKTYDGNFYPCSMFNLTFSRTDYFSVTGDTHLTRCTNLNSDDL